LNKVRPTYIIKSAQIQAPKLEGCKFETLNIPPVFYCILNNICGVGLSNFLINNNYFIYDNDIEWSRDIFPEFVFKRIISINKKAKTGFLNLEKISGNLKIFEEAGFFGHHCSANYAHWLLQILPRIKIFCDTVPESIPILIDKPAHKQINQSLQMVINKRQVIYLNEGDVCMVKKLHYISSTACMPWQITKKKSFFNGWFHPEPLKKLSSHILKKIKSKRTTVLNKLLISRISSNRNVINFFQIRKYFEKKGFKLVSPGHLDFIDQVKLFYESRKIIAPAGSEVSNAIFCGPKTNIFVLIGNDPSGPFGFWRNVLFPLKLNVNLIVGKNNNAKKLFHSDFKISLKKILKRITPVRF
jgi:capsular polysaccharide biosynthesis protein